MTFSTPRLLNSTTKPESTVFTETFSRLFILAILGPLTLLLTTTAFSQDAKPAVTDAFIATPAIWKMTDEDSEVWLLGTYHILPPSVDWRSATVKRAIAAAQAVYLEADIESPDAQGKILRTLMLKGFNPRGTYLSDMLSQEQEAKLLEITDSLDLSFKAINAMRPWNAFITLSAQFIVAKGYDPNSGVDSALSLEIKASGRELRYFETASQQISFFADLPSEVELKLLEMTLDDWDKTTAEFDALFNAWRIGDVPAMDQMINESIRDTSPQVFDVLLTQRNTRWTEELENLMDGSGTYLVAVGAGHLVGDQSVIAMMRQRGFQIKRIKE